MGSFGEHLENIWRTLAERSRLVVLLYIVLFIVREINLERTLYKPWQNDLVKLTAVTLAGCFVPAG